RSTRRRRVGSESASSVRSRWLWVRAAAGIARISNRSVTQRQARRRASLRCGDPRLRSLILVGDALPAVVGVVALDRARRFRGIAPQVLLIHDAVLVHDE